MDGSSCFTGGEAMFAFQLAVMNEEGWGKVLGTVSTADVY